MKILMVGHSYVVALNRRLCREVARAGGDRVSVTVAAPASYHGDLRHMGNLFFPDDPNPDMKQLRDRGANVEDLTKRIDLDPYPATTSDIVALMGPNGAGKTSLARKLAVDMPVTEQVYHVLHHGRPLLEAVKTLLERSYKHELHGIRVPVPR